MKTEILMKCYKIVIKNIEKLRQNSREVKLNQLQEECRYKIIKIVIKSLYPELIRSKENLSKQTCLKFILVEIIIRVM